MIRNDECVIVIEIDYKIWRKFMRKLTYFCLLFLSAAALAGCARTQYLDVAYQMTMHPGLTEGRSIALAVEDLRRTRTTLGPGAQQKMPYFTEIFAYSLQKSGQEKRLVGPYPITGLFMEAFKERLAAIGVAAVPETEAGGRKLQISIQEFSLDLQAGTWVSTIAYEAKIIGDGRILSADIIRGQAQKSDPASRWIRPDVLSENFSDCVNKVNLQKLMDTAFSTVR